MPRMFPTGSRVIGLRGPGLTVSLGDVGDNHEEREGFAAEFAVKVAEHQKGFGEDATAKALTDLLWGLWSGDFDDSIASICAADAAPQSAPGGFLWHRYLNDDSSTLGAKYRAFAAAATKGPVAAQGGNGGDGAGAFGMSEFGLEERAEAKKIQDLVSAMRRETVTFISAPGEVTTQSLAKVWAGMRLAILGHLGQRRGRSGPSFFLLTSSRRTSPSTARLGVWTKGWLWTRQRRNPCWISS